MKKKDIIYGKRHERNKKRREDNDTKKRKPDEDKRPFLFKNGILNDADHKSASPISRQ